MLNGNITWAEIDLESVFSNILAYREFLGQDIDIIAVVKANAYGHGVLPIARTALQAGVKMLAVHRLIEGLELRQGGIDAPVLLMGYTPAEGASLAVEARLTTTITTLKTAQALSAAACRLGVSHPVHIKVDTGMSRYGLFPHEVVDFIKQAASLPRLVVEGIFTHFATADWRDQTHVRDQLALFNQVLERLSQAGYAFRVVHIANSAGAVTLPEARFTAIRLGIAMYGLQPSGEWRVPFALRPALSLKSRVSRVFDLPVGAGVSYGRTFVTRRPTRAALVPVGYGDGYPRSLSNRGVVLIRGRRAPIIGRICMDQFVVDVTSCPGVEQDDEVVLIGSQGGDRISAEEVAALAGTINYEITTSLSPRVARVYRQGGSVLNQPSSR